MEQPPVPEVDRDDGFAEGVDFVDAPQALEALNGLSQVGPDPIRLGLGIEREAAVSLESVLEVPVCKELVEALPSRRLTGALSHAGTEAQDCGRHHSDQAHP